MARGERLEVRRQVQAAPEAVYALVADVEAMGRWSPENVGARWISGTPGTPGARFRGRNRRGLRRWSTTCQVTAADPGRRFAFDVTHSGLAVASWDYGFEAVDGGCEVTETWTDRRGRPMVLLGTIGTGVADRVAHNRVTMTATLEALAGAAEGAGRP